MVEVNLFGVVHGMRLALPGMLERGRGHIVTAATRREYADRGVSITAVLPSAVDTALASGLDMRPIPKVKPEEIANAVVGSVSSRKAEVAVPSYVGGLAALATVTPEPLLNSVRRLVRDDRALRPDSDERADYQARLEAQRHGRADG
jgi:short-subunit dehydrogenase